MKPLYEFRRNILVIINELDRGHPGGWFTEDTIFSEYNKFFGKGLVVEGLNDNLKDTLTFFEKKGFIKKAPDKGVDFWEVTITTTGVNALLDIAAQQKEAELCECRAENNNKKEAARKAYTERAKEYREEAEKILF